MEVLDIEGRSTPLPDDDDDDVTYLPAITNRRYILLGCITCSFRYSQYSKLAIRKPRIGLNQELYAESCVIVRNVMYAIEFLVGIIY